mmetsp:Transcript_41873/g.126762  ORF Transcript_41873/g.126762 Transcript_41873/m.126762 type:complete len:224 (-) Transcript_41873:12-683(-)
MGVALAALLDGTQVNVYGLFQCLFGIHDLHVRSIVPLLRLMLLRHGSLRCRNRLCRGCQGILAGVGHACRVFQMRLRLHSRQFQRAFRALDLIDLSLPGVQASLILRFDAAHHLTDELHGRALHLMPLVGGHSQPTGQHGQHHVPAGLRQALRLPHRLLDGLQHGVGSGLLCRRHRSGCLPCGALVASFGRHETSRVPHGGGSRERVSCPHRHRGEEGKGELL